MTPVAEDGAAAWQITEQRDYISYRVSDLLRHSGLRATVRISDLGPADETVTLVQFPDRTAEACAELLSLCRAVVVDTARPLCLQLSHLRMFASVSGQDGRAAVQRYLGVVL